MKRRPKAVGIYNDEIFIANFDEEGNINGFDVLRSVTKNMLEELRDADSYEDYCEDLWKCAVQAGSTKLGLHEFAQELIDEADVDNDEEAFPLKDDSGIEYLTEEERELADKFLLEHSNIEVGTWEASGSYPPTYDQLINGQWVTTFKKFDYVFDEELAKKCYVTL